MGEELTVIYVVGYTIYTTKFSSYILTDVRDLGKYEFPKADEVHVVQMFGGHFGRSLFLVRTVTDDRIMRNLRVETDPPVTYKAAPKRFFLHLE